MKEKEDIKISLSTFFLFISIILIIILACFIIYVFKENQKLSNKNMDLDARLALIENGKVEKQESINESVAMKINELASLSNIQDVAKEHGLDYNNDNIIVVK